MYKLVGGDGSPYTCKVRAVLRYRRIPYRFVPMFDLGGPGMYKEHFPKLKAKVIPVLVRPDSTYTNDSTPILRELDRVHPQRQLTPKAPGLAFLASLVEDFADEWLTKSMFEARFHTAFDAEFGAKWQYLQNPVLAKAGGAEMATFFATRQIGRRYLVSGKHKDAQGKELDSWEVAESWLRAVCQVIKLCVHCGDGFVFGQRPCHADFALYGQLRQLVADPRSAPVFHDYPEVFAWVWKCDDASGLKVPDDDAITASSSGGMTQAMQAVLKLVGAVYVPFLLANAAAVERGDKGFSVSVHNDRFGTYSHTQPSFKYQWRCLNELRREFAALPAAELAFVKTTLQKCGVDAAAFEMRPSASL